MSIRRPDGTTRSFAYDAIRRTTSITDTLGHTSLSYDPLLGTLQEIRNPNGTILRTDSDRVGHRQRLSWAGIITGSVTMTSTLHERRVQQQVNDTSSISFQADAAGRLIQAGALALSNDPGTGRLQGSVLGQVADSWAYTGFGEPIDYQATISATSAFSTTATRDGLGRVLAQTASVLGVTTPLSYTYDLTGQLTEVWQAGSRMARYHYDQNGNRVSSTTDQGVVIGVYDVQDRLLQYGDRSYTYTLNGEQASTTTQGHTTSYAYDPVGNLQQVTLPDGTQIQYVLDALGRRIGKRVNSTLVQGFLYQDDLRPVAELDGAGNIVSQFVYATRLNVPDYMIKGGHSYRILSDERGSPRLVVDSVTGEVVQRIAYDVFGVITQDTNPGFQPFGFAGGLYDQHSQLTHFGAREYDAYTGRWSSKDPLIFGGGDTNLYRYVGNDPVNYIDPTGEFPWAAVLIGAAIGAGIDLRIQQLTKCPNEPFDWWEVGLSALSGAVGGGTGTYFAKKIGVAWIRALANMGVGAIMGGVTTITHGYVTNHPASSIEIALSMGTNAVASGAGSLIGDGIFAGKNRIGAYLSNRQAYSNMIQAIENPSAYYMGTYMGNLNPGRLLIERKAIGVSVGDGVGMGISNSSGTFNFFNPPQCNCK